MGAEAQPAAADGGYARGVAHCLLVFIPVVVFLCWWLRQTLKKQQQVKAEPTAALAESQFLSELFLLELVLVSAAELSAVRESLADKSQQTKIHGSDADRRDKSTREALCGRRDQVMPILEKQLAALYKRLQPIADELLASRKDQVAGLEGGASADKKGE